MYRPSDTKLAGKFSVEKLYTTNFVDLSINLVANTDMLFWSEWQLLGLIFGHNEICDENVSLWNHLVVIIIYVAYMPAYCIA